MEVLDRFRSPHLWQRLIRTCISPHGEAGRMVLGPLWKDTPQRTYRSLQPGDDGIGDLFRSSSRFGDEVCQLSYTRYVSFCTVLFQMY